MLGEIMYHVMLRIQGGLVVITDMHQEENVFYRHVVRLAFWRWTLFH